jgi:hypothetical protein
MYIYTHILHYYDILCHIVLYSTWYIQLISYSDLCTTSPSTTHVSELTPMVSSIFYGGNESKFHRQEPTTSKKEEVILRLNTLLKYFICP